MPANRPRNKSCPLDWHKSCLHMSRSLGPRPGPARGPVTHKKKEELLYSTSPPHPLNTPAELLVLVLIGR